MRKLTDFYDKSTARALGDYLLSNGIENQIDEEEESQWSVWVHDDDLLEQARERLEFFRANPTHHEIRKAVQKADQIRAEQKREEKEDRSKPIDVRTRWHMDSIRPLFVTMGLIGISVLVFIFQNFVPNGSRFTDYLFISNRADSAWPPIWMESQEANKSVFPPPLIYALKYVAQGKSFGEIFSGNYYFSEILRGQVWRLFTPMFLHFGILHIFFNMSWIGFLGPMIERRKGALVLLAQVLVIALVSNVLQYVFHGPRFGGMSGVVCGLFGYAWMMGRYNSGEGIAIDRNTVIYFVAFLLIALFGMLGPIANTAHFAGLFTGMLWGYADSGRLRWKWRRITSRNSPD